MKITVTFPTHPVIAVWNLIRIGATIGAFAWGGPAAGFCAIIASVSLTEKQ